MSIEHLAIRAVSLSKNFRTTPKGIAYLSIVERMTYLLPVAVMRGIAIGIVVFDK